jgi:hypothetical protein
MNALSYLYTNKAIDKDMRIRTKRIDFYLNILDKQAGVKLFDIMEDTLVPIQENFNTMRGLEQADEVAPIPSYTDRIAEGRSEAKEVWNNSDKKLPSGFDEDQRMYLEELFNEGILELNCTL